MRYTIGGSVTPDRKLASTSSIVEVNPDRGEPGGRGFVKHTDHRTDLRRDASSGRSYESSLSNNGTSRAFEQSSTLQSPASLRVVGAPNDLEDLQIPTRAQVGVSRSNSPSPHKVDDHLISKLWRHSKRVLHRHALSLPHPSSAYVSGSDAETEHVSHHQSSHDKSSSGGPRELSPGPAEKVVLSPSDSDVSGSPNHCRPSPSSRVSLLRKGILYSGSPSTEPVTSRSASFSKNTNDRARSANVAFPSASGDSTSSIHSVVPGPLTRISSTSSPERQEPRPPPSFPTKFYDRLSEVELDSQVATQGHGEALSGSTTPDVQPHHLQPVVSPRSTSTSSPSSGKPYAPWTSPTARSHDAQPIFYDTIHHFSECPHTVPPAHRPLNGLFYTGRVGVSPKPPLTSTTVMSYGPDSRSTIQGRCFECDGSHRRERESSVLAAHNPQLDHLVNLVRHLLSKLESGEDDHNDRPEDSDGTTDVKGKAKDCGSLPSGSDSNADVDTDKDGIPEAIHILEERFDRLITTRDREVGKIWQGYNSRWGPGLLGVQSRVRPPSLDLSSTLSRSSRSSFTETTRGHGRSQSSMTTTTTATSPLRSGSHSLRHDLTSLRGRLDSVLGTNKGHERRLSSRAANISRAPSAASAVSAANTNRTTSAWRASSAASYASNASTARGHSDNSTLAPDEGRMQIGWIRPESRKGEGEGEGRGEQVEQAGRGQDRREALPPLHRQRQRQAAQAALERITRKVWKKIDRSDSRTRE